MSGWGRARVSANSGWRWLHQEGHIWSKTLEEDSGEPYGCLWKVSSR